MFDLLKRLRFFPMKIPQEEFVLKERREIAAVDMAIFIDGGAEHHAAVLPIPGGIVRASPEK
jgi:hypothetical protein